MINTDPQFALSTQRDSTIPVHTRNKLATYTLHAKSSTIGQWLYILC